MKTSKIEITRHWYLSKKFLGLVFAFDCNKPLLPYTKSSIVFEIKFIYFGCYLIIDNLHS